MSGCPFHSTAERISEICTRTFQRPGPDGKRDRTFHRRAIGCLRGTFTVTPPDVLPLRHGLFAQAGSYPVIARYSSALHMTEKYPDALGLSLKLTEVPGQVLEGAPAGQQDFVMVNQEFFLTKDAADAEALFSTLDGKLTMTPAILLLNRFVFRSWNPFRYRWRYVMVALDSVVQDKKHRGQPHRMGYYSQTPYQLGESAMKFRVRTTHATSGKGGSLPERLSHALLNAPLELIFEIQLISEGESTDDAQSRWSGPWHPVARISFPSQDAGEQIPPRPAIGVQPLERVGRPSSPGFHQCCAPTNLRSIGETTGSRFRLTSD